MRGCCECVLMMRCRVSACHACPGHASAADQRQPPRGVQLTLAPAGPRAKAEAPVGTIVMANLGYFQARHRERHSL